MGLCVRIFVLIFLLIFTACAVCSSLFPQFYAKKGWGYLYLSLFKNNATEFYPENVKLNYWSITGNTPSDMDITLSYYNMSLEDVGGPLFTKISIPTRKAFASCPDRQSYFTASGALAIAGAAFGGLATLLAAGHLCSTANCCLACSILLFCLVAFACMAVSFALMIVVYLKSMCGGDGFKVTVDLKEGFALSVAACGGFLITSFIELCA